MTYVLQALSLSDGPDIDARSSLARHLMDLYEAAGNTIAHQVLGQPLSSWRHALFWHAHASVRRFPDATADTCAGMRSPTSFLLGCFQTAFTVNRVTLISNLIPASHVVLQEISAEAF